MKKPFYSLVAMASLFVANTASAAENWLGMSNSKLREGNVWFEDIPNIIINVTDFLLWLVGSLTVIAIIYGAVRMGFWSLSNDKETGKKIITGSIFGLVLALSGWFIINFVISNL